MLLLLSASLLSLFVSSHLISSLLFDSVFIANVDTPPLLNLLAIYLATHITPPHPLEPATHSLKRLTRQGLAHVRAPAVEAKNAIRNGGAIEVLEGPEKARTGIEDRGTGSMSVALAISLAS